MLVSLGDRNRDFALKGLPAPFVPEALEWPLFIFMTVNFMAIFQRFALRESRDFDSFQQ